MGKTNKKVNRSFERNRTVKAKQIQKMKNFKIDPNNVEITDEKEDWGPYW